MKLIIGQAATSEFYYNRKPLVDKFWSKVKNGNNILMSAPRRIGKTSLMRHFEDKQEEGYHVIYIITESVNNENEFYRKIFKRLFEELKSSQKFFQTVGNIVKQNRLSSIGADGTFSIEAKEINYFNELRTLIKIIDLQENKILLMIDEFAQTVENIKLDEGDQSAIHFLASNRELRIDPMFNTKLQFVYAGSIGLENVVSLLNQMGTINDLYPFVVPPFKREEAIKYIQEIPLSECNYEFHLEQVNYLIEKIEWLIPFYINIILDEIDELFFEREFEKVSNKEIDNAFENCLLKRSYFEHWHTRLRISHRSEHYNFSKKILNSLSENGEITSNEILNIAVGHGIVDTYKDVLNSLVYDGYISGLNDKYHFNSPLLKEWWKRNVAN